MSLTDRLNSSHYDMDKELKHNVTDSSILNSTIEPKPCYNIEINNNI